MSRHVPASQGIASGPDLPEKCARVGVEEVSENQENQLDQDSISALIKFFRALDEWDRQAKLQ
jgi:hypothetical protein